VHRLVVSINISGICNHRPRLVPRSVASLHAIAIERVACGAEHTLACAKDGRLYRFVGWCVYVSFALTQLLLVGVAMLGVS
jgi:hypothetical protein